MIIPSKICFVLHMILVRETELKKRRPVVKIAIVAMAMEIFFGKLFRSTLQL